MTALVEEKRARWIRPRCCDLSRPAAVPPDRASVGHEVDEAQLLAGRLAGCLLAFRALEEQQSVAAQLQTVLDSCIEALADLSLSARRDRLSDVARHARSRGLLRSWPMRWLARCTPRRTCAPFEPTQWTEREVCQAWKRVDHAERDPVVRCLVRRPSERLLAAACAIDSNDDGGRISFVLFRSRSRQIRAGR